MVINYPITCPAINRSLDMVDRTFRRSNKEKLLERDIDIYLSKKSNIFYDYFNYIFYFYFLKCFGLINMHLPS